MPHLLHMCVIFKKWPGNMKKRWFYTSVGKSHKRKFWVEKRIFGEESTTGKTAFQSNFNFKMGGGNIKVF